MKHLWCLLWMGILVVNGTAAEMRGIWVDAFEPGFKTKAQVKQLVADCREYTASDPKWSYVIQRKFFVKTQNNYARFNLEVFAVYNEGNAFSDQVCNKPEWFSQFAALILMSLCDVFSSF